MNRANRGLYWWWKMWTATGFLTTARGSNWQAATTTCRPRVKTPPLHITTRYTTTPTPYAGARTTALQGHCFQQRHTHSPIIPTPSCSPESTCTATHFRATASPEPSTSATRQESNSTKHRHSAMPTATAHPAASTAPSLTTHIIPTRKAR